MRASDRGFVAMMDAVLFIAVIMIAAAVTVAYADSASSEDRDVPGFLEDLMLSEVRMSDMAEGDDSLVKVSDLAALELATGEGGALEYLEEALDAFAKGRPCVLSLTYSADGRDDATATIGEAGSLASVSYSMEIPVTAGGTLAASLTLYSS